MAWIWCDTISARKKLQNAVDSWVTSGRMITDNEFTNSFWRAFESAKNTNIFALSGLNVMMRNIDDEKQFLSASVEYAHKIWWKTKDDVYNVTKNIVDVRKIDNAFLKVNIQTQPQSQYWLAAHSLWIKDFGNKVIWSWIKVSDLFTFGDNWIRTYYQTKVAMYMNDVKSSLSNNIDWLVAKTTDQEILNMLNDAKQYVTSHEFFANTSAWEFLNTMQDNKFASFFWKKFLWNESDGSLLFNYFSKKDKDPLKWSLDKLWKWTLKYIGQDWWYSITPWMYQKAVLGKFWDYDILWSRKWPAKVLRTVGKVSKLLSWAVSIPALVTSSIWYAMDLDAWRFLIDGNTMPWLVEDWMRRFWIDPMQWMQLQVNEYARKHWLDWEELNWLVYNILTKSNILSKWVDHHVWIADVVSNYLKSQWMDRAWELASKISQISNWRQDIADIWMWGHVRKMAFELATQFHAWSTQWALYKLELLRNRAAREWWAVAVEYERFLDAVNRTYKRNENFLLWMSQEYWLWGFNTWKFWTAVMNVFWFQWARWIGKFTNTIMYMAWTAKEVIAKVAMWMDIKDIALTTDLTPILHFANMIWLSLRSSQFLSRWLDDGRELDNESFIEDMSMVSAFFQSIQSNWITRIMLQLWDAGRSYFNKDKDTLVLDDGTTLNIWNLLIANKLLSSIWAEMFGEVRSIKELIKLAQAYGRDWWLWVSDYFVNKFMKQLNYKSIYAAYGDVEFSYDTDTAFGYYLLWAASPEQKAKFEWYRLGNSLQYLLDNKYHIWASIYLRALYENIPAYTIFKQVNQWDKLWQADKEWLRDVVYGTWWELLNNGDYRWFIKYIQDSNISAVDKELMVRWFHKIVKDQLIDKKNEYSSSWWYEWADGEWIDEWTLWVWEKIEWNTIWDYISWIRPEFTLEKSMIEEWFWKDHPFTDKYWGIDLKQIHELTWRWGKEARLAMLMDWLWVDPSAKWWWYVFLKMMSTVTNNSIEWGRYVVKWWAIITREEAIQAHLSNVAKNNPELLQVETLKFYKKKWGLKATTPRLVFDDAWNSRIVKTPSKDIEFQDAKNQYLTETFWPALKATNIDAYGKVSMAWTAYTEYKINKNPVVWKLFTKLDEFDKVPEIWFEWENLIRNEILMQKWFAEWDITAVLWLANPMWKSKLLWPKDASWKLIPEDQRSMEQRNNHELLNVFFLKKTIQSISDMPIDNTKKAVAYAWLLQNWWFDVLSRAEKIKDRLPQEARWAYEKLSFSIAWAMPAMINDVRNAIIDEAEYLSWLSAKWGAVASWSGKWKKWKTPTLSKSDLDIMKAFEDKINESNFKPLQLQNAKDRQAISFKPWETDIMRKSWGRWPAYSKSYDTSKWWKTVNGASKWFSYGRWATNRSKKKGLKTLALR